MSDNSVQGLMPAGGALRTQVWMVSAAGHAMVLVILVMLMPESSIPKKVEPFQWKVKVGTQESSPASGTAGASKLVERAVANRPEEVPRESPVARQVKPLDSRAEPRSSQPVEKERSERRPVVETKNPVRKTPVPLRRQVAMTPSEAVLERTQVPNGGRVVRRRPAPVSSPSPAVVENSPESLMTRSHELPAGAASASTRTVAVGPSTRGVEERAQPIVVGRTMAEGRQPKGAEFATSAVTGRTDGQPVNRVVRTRRLPVREREIVQRIASLAMPERLGDGEGNGGPRRILQPDAGGGSLGQKDFGWIGNLLRARIEEVKRYSYEARLKEWEGRTVISAAVLSDGQIVDLRVAESSGNRRLDEDARALVARASPLMLPRDLGLSKVVVNVPIVFGLH